MACSQDAEASEIVKKIQEKANTNAHFTLSGSQLMYKGRLFARWAKVMVEFHEGYKGGHAGVHRAKRITRSFAWPGLHTDVKAFVAACHICQRNRYETMNPPGTCNPRGKPG